MNLIVQLEKDPFAGQPCSAQDSTTNTTKTQLGSVDTYFVTQTSLGTPFQTDSGRIAQKRGGTQAIRSYAELMVGSHIEVNDALEGITKRITPATKKVTYQPKARVLMLRCFRLISSRGPVFLGETVLDDSLQSADSPAGLQTIGDVL